MLSSPKKYNDLIYHMRKVKEIANELNENDLNVLTELLQIEQSKRKIINIKIKDRRREDGGMD